MNLGRTASSLASSDPFDFNEDMNPRADNSAASGPQGRSIARRARAVRWLCRALMVAAAAVLVAAVLPAVMPRSWLGRLFQDALSESFGSPVSVAAAEWGWWRGFQLRGVRVGPSDRPAVTAEAATLEAEPWDLLLTGKIRRVSLEGVTVRLAVDYAGAVTLDVPRTRPDRSKARPEAAKDGTPAARQRRTGSRFSVSHFVLSDCIFLLRDSIGGRSATVQLSGLTASLDRRSGVLEWRLAGRAGGGLFASEGRLVVPRLAAGPAELGGEAKLAWQAIRLDGLPRGLLPRLGLASAAGELAGKVTLRLNSEWVLDWQARLAARQLTLQDTAGRQVAVPQVSAAVSGQWQMIDQRIRVAAVELDSPALRLKAEEPALVYEGRTGRIVQANASVELRDIETLVAAAGRLGLRLPQALRLTGQCTVSATIGRQEEATVLRCRLVGDSTAVDWPGVFAHPAGRPLRFRAVCRFYDGGRIALEEGRFELSGGQVVLAAAFVLPRGEPAGQVTLKRASLAFRWEDPGSFAGHFPAVAEALASYGRLAGPGEGRLWISASNKGGFVGGATCRLPETAEAAFGGWFTKPPGVWMQMDLNGSVNQRLDTLSIDRVKLAASDAIVLETSRMVLTASRARRERGGPEAAALWVDLDAGVSRADVSQLRRFCPRVAEAIRPLGDVSGAVAGRLALRCRAELAGGMLSVAGATAAGELDLTGVALALDDLVEKSAGRRLLLTASGSYWRDEQGPSGRVLASVEADGLAGQIVWEARPGGTGPRQWCWGWFEVDRVAEVAASLPVLARAVRDTQVEGALRGRWEWVRWADSFELRSGLDMTNLAVRSDRPRIHKPAGMPAKLALALSGVAGPRPDEGFGTWRLSRAELRLGGCTATITDAELEVQEPWSPIRRAAGKVSGVIAFDERIASLSEALGEWLERHRASGVLKWALEGRYDLGSGLEVTGQVDASDVALTALPIRKATGVPLKISVEGRARLSADDDGMAVAEVDVRQATGEAGGVVWSAEGRASVGLKAGRLELLAADVAGTANSPKLGDLAGLLAPAEQLVLHGSVGLAGRCRFDRQSGWRIENLEIGCWPGEGRLLGVGCRVEGLVRVGPGFAETSGLAVRAGRTAGRVTFHAEWGDEALRGQIGTIFERIDADELQLMYKSAGRLLEPGSGIAFQTPGFDLRRLDARFAGRSDLLEGALPAGQARFEVHGLGWEGRIRDGGIRAEAVGAFEGGPLVVRLTGPLVSGQGPLEVYYAVKRALPTEPTRMLVARSFPGLQVAGLVTWIETLPLDPAGLSGPSIPGKGELIVEGGEVRGRAAPEKIAQLFPGLKLARFKFRRLHNWFERDSQGKTINRMIFRSVPWSLYMNGWSLLDGRFQYEVGIDLLGPLESEYWAEVDKGRIPLFTKMGRVVDGRIEGEVVRYLSPQQVLARILKDNVLTVAYHMVRQRVAGQRAK